MLQGSTWCAVGLIAPKILLNSANAHSAYGSANTRCPFSAISSVSGRYFIHRQVGRMLKNPCSCCCVDEVSSISSSSTVKPLCEQSLSAVCHKRLQQWQAGVGEKKGKAARHGCIFPIAIRSHWVGLLRSVRQQKSPAHAPSGITWGPLQDSLQ